MISHAKSGGEKPDWILSDYWTIMQRHWATEKAKGTSEKARASRMSDRNGLGPHSHRAGSRSFLRVKDVLEANNEDYSFIAVMKKTHQKPDGSYVDQRARLVADTYEKHVQERLCQLESAGEENLRAETIDNHEKNEIYIKAAVSSKHGHIFGLGALMETLPSVGASSSAPQASEEVETITHRLQEMETDLKKSLEENLQIQKILEAMEKLVETFASQNMPLVEAIHLSPTIKRYVKTMVTKNLTKECSVMMISEQGSDIIQERIPRKLPDPGTFVLSVTINHDSFPRALCDLGSSVNLMPRSVAMRLGNSNLEPTFITLVLADRSTRIPDRILIDVPVMIGKSMIPTDFVVLPYEKKPKDPIILGRSFLHTGGAIIDVRQGRIGLNVGDLTIQFDMNTLVKKPIIEGKTFLIDFFTSSASDSISEMELEDPLERVLVSSIEDSADLDSKTSTYTKLLDETEHVMQLTVEEALPSVTSTSTTTSDWDPTKAPKIELKPLLAGLKTSDVHRLQKAECCYQERPFPLTIYRSDVGEIPIHPDDHEKTTFTCPYGTFAYGRMLFGLHNVLATFQRGMMSIFTDMIEDIMEVFMDDFSVYGSSFEDCLENLCKVFARCEEKHLVLNWEKCHFMVQDGIVLVHRISEHGIEVDRAKIEVMTSLQALDNVKAVKSFLGHASFYRRFIKDFSRIARPLTALLCKEVKFEFTQECHDAFQQIKQALISAPIVQPPDWDLPFEVMCDVSDFAVGTVLGQRKDKKLHAIYYASRTLDDAQRNYATTEKELLAVVFAFEKFRSYLVGSKVIVHTDDAALKYLIQNSSYGGHFATFKTVSKVLQAGFWWSTMFRDAQKFISQCDPYQRRGKISKRNEMPHKFILEVEVFDCWGIDFMGPFPSSNKNLYILVAVDYVSKWVEAIASPKNDSVVVMKLFKSIIFPCFGVPRIIISDGGKHFINKILAKLLLHYGVKHRVATPYHPQTSGQVEVSNRQIKEILEKTVAWAVKMINFDIKSAGERRLIQLNELVVIRIHAYDNSKLYKERTKAYDDKKILTRTFKPNDQGRKRRRGRASDLPPPPPSLTAASASPPPPVTTHPNRNPKLHPLNLLFIDFHGQSFQMREFLLKGFGRKMSTGNSLKRLQIEKSVLGMLDDIGLGTISCRQYDLYPEVVKQFMTSVRVSYVNDRKRNAQEGALIFFIRGVRYRLPLRDLCDIYGFDNDITGVFLPGQFKDAVHLGIHHPVLRYLVRLISSTLLCKMEPSKMRLSELLLLYHALHDFFPDSLGFEQVDRRGQKSERVGSLLTPIFEHFRISFEGEEVNTTRVTMDETYLKNSHRLKGNLLWCFRDDRGQHMIQLPRPALTENTGEHEEIAFHPDPSLLHAAPRTRRQRGSAAGSAPTQTEDEFIDPAGGPRVGSSSSALPYQLPSPPPIPMEPQDDDCKQYERKSICDLLHSMEIGKVRVVCTIYALDLDWSWYYFSCRNCNKKVTHIHAGVNTTSLKSSKPRFWCDVYKNAVTNVQAKYMLYVKVMDGTGETKCLLFDTIYADMVGESCTSMLGGSFNETEDPNDVPDGLRNLVGKTFLFLVSVEKENIWDSKDSFKVTRLLSNDGLCGDEVLEDLEYSVNPASIISRDQETSDSVTPLSKRVYTTKLSDSEQSSSSKKLCVQPLDLEKSEPEFNDELATKEASVTTCDSIVQVCERSLTSAIVGPNGPFSSSFVRAKMLSSGFLIRPCDGGGSIIHIVDHVDLDVSSVPKVLRPLYESSKILEDSTYWRVVSLEVLEDSTNF
ncbi:Ribonuclease H-like superfamily [Arabidopsis suecica]|uniref:Ribonuclease H-like superfamily n=1 Tax=Arabidopsis suecica TaxID=45249 RepID=A0A8T2DGZ5_ARASU|nr:Ribonuclease H-like superfamily [Arabidopsis suecica]